MGQTRAHPGTSVFQECAPLPVSWQHRATGKQEVESSCCGDNIGGNGLPVHKDEADHEAMLVLVTIDALHVRNAEKNSL